MSDAISRKRAVRRIVKQARQRDPVIMSPHDAVGLVASHDISAFCHVPEQACSLRDGFAMRTADIEKTAPMNPVTLPVTQTVLAESRNPDPVEPGTAARVLTGGTVPPGADCVLAEEDVEIEGSSVTVRTPVRPGWFIRPVGGDIELGSPIIRAGEAITPQGAAVMIRTRNTSVHVHPAPTAEILSLGSELSDPTCCGEECDTARFPADNLVLAGELLLQSGCDIVRRAVLPDSREQLVAALCRPDLPDVIVTTGGTGRSERDFARSGAEEAGFTVVADHVDIRPGRNMFAAVRDRTILFCLPGPPAAVFACYHAVILPVVRHLRGLPEPMKPVVARFEKGVSARPGGEWVVLCRLHHEGAVLTATPLTGREMPPMLAMGIAHGVAILPGGGGVLPGGDGEIVSTSFSG